MISKKPKLTVDPLKLIEQLWPDVRLYDKQVEALYSAFENDETFVPAGNMLGKDFIGGLIIVTFFLTRTPCRIITTSAKDDHLRVLWGEIHKFIQSSKYPLDYKSGGPLIINQRELKRYYHGEECKISYVKGMVASADSIAAMQGHHVAKTGDGIPRTMAFIDESSSVEDMYYPMFKTWTHSLVSIGNTWECDNFFKRAIMGDDRTGDPGGDVERDHRDGFHRKVIKITAEDSPNVKLALKEIAAGKKPSFKQVIPGVKDYEEYMVNRKRMDAIQQCVCLDAEFYEGEEVKLVPMDWMKSAHEISDHLDKTSTNRNAVSMGVDGGEGRSKTVWTISDHLGVIEQYSEATHDTSIIVPKTIAFGEMYNIPPPKWLFDRGGGGKQYVDLLRKKGYKCTSISFGEAATDVNRYRKGMKTSDLKTEENETRTVYKNRRAEMYGMLRFKYLDPMNQERDRDGNYISGGFGIPRRLDEITKQLKPLPLLFDGEGVLYLPPKDKKDTNSKQKTIKELLGKSPDETDSLVLSIFGLSHKARRTTVGAMK